MTHICSNTIKTCLTPNHLLVDRQSLYSSNTTSITIVKNLTVLWSTTDKINRMSNHFLDRWRCEYVVNLRETQWTSKLNINSLKINFNDIVLVFYEKLSRNFWRIVTVMRVLPSKDSEIRGEIVRITKTNTILKRPVNKLLPVEYTYHDTKLTDKVNHKDIASQFTSCPVNCEYSWKKTQIENKRIMLYIYEQTFGVWWVKSVLILCRLSFIKSISVHPNIQGEYF